jgi:hypothetical protein
MDDVIYEDDITIKGMTNPSVSSHVHVHSLLEMFTMSRGVEID